MKRTKLEFPDYGETPISNLTPAQETELCTCLDAMIEEADEYASHFESEWGEYRTKEQAQKRAEIARARAILKEVRG
jgi:hypothetical protein